MQLKTVFLLFLMGFSLQLTGQDIHFSQIHASPPLLNPAMTGVHQGSARLIANFRNQWRSVTANYRTLMFSADTNIFGLGSHQSIGVGALFYSDVAGDLDYSTNFAGISISSIRSFDRDNSHILVGGLQVGNLSNRFDPTKIIAHDPSEDFPDGQNRLSLLDISAGLLWYKRVTKDQFIYLGGAIYHVNRPIFSFGKNQKVGDRMYRRFVLHGGANLYATDRVKIIPNVIYMRQGPFQQFTAGSFVRYDLPGRTGNEPSAFMAGGWFRGLSLSDRLGIDAFIATFRMEAGKYLFTFSYDINVSSLAKASYGRGGPEVSVIYIIGRPQTRYKRKSGELPRKTKHRIKCPYF